MELTGLEPCTTYFVGVESADGQLGGGHQAEKRRRQGRDAAAQPVDLVARRREAYAELAADVAAARDQDS